MCRDRAWGENLASCPGFRKVRVSGRHDLRGIQVVGGEEEEQDDKPFLPQAFTGVVAR